MDQSQNEAWFFEFTSKVPKLSARVPTVSNQARITFDTLFPHVPVDHQASPALLPDTDDSRELLTAAGQAWRTAVHQRLGKCFPAKPARAPSLAGLKILRDRKISPAVWAAWCLRFVPAFNSSLKAKIFAAGTIKAKLPKFLDTADQCTRCTLVLPEHRACFTLRTEAEILLDSHGADYPSDVYDLLGGKALQYREALRVLRKAVEEYRVEEQRKLKRHLWIWNRSP